HDLGAALHALEQRTIGDAGRGENAVALGHFLETVDAIEIVDSPAPGASNLVVVAEQQAALHLAANAAQRGRRQDALGRTAGADVDVDPGFGVRGGNHAGDVAVGDELDPATERPQLGDD